MHKIAKTAAPNDPPKTRINIIIPNPKPKPKRG
jgi:hypothetical protein